MSSGALHVLSGPPRCDVRLAYKTLSDYEHESNGLAGHRFVCHAAGTYVV